MSDFMELQLALESEIEKIDENDAFKRRFKNLIINSCEKMIEDRVINEVIEMGKDEEN